jgi:hypothetical protein
MACSARSAAFIGLASAALVALSNAATAQRAVAIPAAAQELAGQHPAEYYKRASQSFKAGSKEEAVFLFYLGQLRYRTHLLARPDLDPTGDRALFDSLGEMVGRPINEYAFGDVPALAHTVDAVLAYDQDHPDTFTPPAEFARVHSDVREGLSIMKAKMLEEADAIRATRTRNGLENRQ